MLPVPNYTEQIDCPIESQIFVICKSRVKNKVFELIQIDERVLCRVGTKHIVDFVYFLKVLFERRQNPTHAVRRHHTIRDFVPNKKIDIIFEALQVGRFRFFKPVSEHTVVSFTGHPLIYSQHIILTQSYNKSVLKFAI